MQLLNHTLIPLLLLFIRLLNAILLRLLVAQAEPLVEILAAGENVGEEEIEEGP